MRRRRTGSGKSQRQRTDEKQTEIARAHEVPRKYQHKVAAPAPDNAAMIIRMISIISCFQLIFIAFSIKEIFVVNILDDFATDREAAFNLAHCKHERNHLFAVGPGKNFVGLKPGQNAALGNVSSGVVLAVRSPGTDDLGNCVTPIVNDVAADDREAGTQPEIKADELFELRIGRVLDLAHPVIANPDVQRIVIAKSSRVHGRRN